jgi:hypothetical protein
MANGMYFDAVVVAETMIPVFNGTKEETLQFLRDNPSIDRWHRVVRGENLEQMTVADYVAKYGNGDPISDG